MHPTVTQYAQALEELSADAPVDASTLVANLARSLKRAGQTQLLPAILSELTAREALGAGVLAVRVVTAYEADQATRKQLLHQAEALFPGKKIETTFETEQSVIGGVRFETATMLYDATLATKLAQLKKSISK
jgi:F-type H+-transporting ATPase subunit delta